MTDARGPWFERPLARTAGVLALLAYLPALTAAPGRMPSDSKLYLYLDPGRFLADAASTFDGRQFAGWVPHQHVAYLWPSAPWFWLFDSVGVPDWVAHRLWIGTIMLAAGLGVRWCARLLGLGAMAAFAAAIVYQLSLYVLPYVSRTSVMLLPWAGLGWIVALTIRATRRRTWGDPAAIALVVFTVGAVNATALAMIVPGPALWLVHAAWQRSISWRGAAVVALRVGVLSVAVSLWWIVMLLIQGRYGTDVLPYSESLADVSLTATSPETWRGFGYWLLYVRDPYAPTTTESLRYLSSTPAILVSYLLPLLALAALAWVRWSHRRFAALLIGVGLVLAVGVHPVDDRSPLMRLFAGGDGGLALALRSSTRALPVMMLGVAFAIAMGVEASATYRRPSGTIRGHWVTGGVVALVAVSNLPALWNGGFVDPALERDQDPPQAWADAARDLDASGDGGRVLQLPGAEFGAYRWGYTVDQPLPGLTDKPLVTRDLLPLGSAGAMDLLFALDDRVQEGTLEPESLAPVARLLGVDTVWLTNDIAFDRFRTARPEVVRDVVSKAPDIGPLMPYGELFLNRPDVPVTDERAVGDPRVGEPLVPVELAAVSQPGRIVRAAPATLVVSGSGDGVVDAAAAGLIASGAAAIRYSADLEEPAAVLDDAIGLLVTDSNRDRARHWRSSQDTTGYTEPGGPEQDVLRSVAADARLELFETDEATSQTIAEQRGPVTAKATAYGEPFSYLPEHRPFMAIDGDPATAWIVGDHGDPIGETLQLEYAGALDGLTLHQATDGAERHVTSVSVSVSGASPSARRFELDERSWSADGQPIALATPGPSGVVEITVEAVEGGEPFTGSAVAGVGFSEVDHGLGRTVEVVRPPHDALPGIDATTPLAISFNRLRTDPMDRWRGDAERTLVREFDLPVGRQFDVAITARIDGRAPDRELAELFDWPAVASSRLAGSPRHAGVAALDGLTDTAWITAFGEAAGAALTMTVAQPIDSIEVGQPVTGFSRVSSLILRSGAEERTVELVPDAAGRATAVVDPPLPPGDVSFVIAGIDAVTTIDRRFADPVELPAAITELRFDGRPTIPPLGSTSTSIPCSVMGSIDDQRISATIVIDGDAWLDGGALGVEPCEPTLQLEAGTHVIAASPGGPPITLDRVVFDSGLRQGLTEDTSMPTVDVRDQSRFARTVRVDDCPRGCWLIVGEGYSDGWSAAGPRGSLGEPTPVDGGFNGWWIPASDTPVDVEVSWTAQRGLTWALVLSGLAALVSVILVARDRRRATGEAPRKGSSPLWWSRDRDRDRPLRARSLVAVSWIALSGLLVAPEWALGGALAGAVVILAPWRRVPELTALASVLVVAVMVVVRERRLAPLPDGGWPTTFDSLHPLGMFAVACVLVAALASDDADEADDDDDADDTVDGVVSTADAKPEGAAVR